MLKRLSFGSFTPDPHLVAPQITPAIPRSSPLSVLSSTTTSSLGYPFPATSPALQSIHSGYVSTTSTVRGAAAAATIERAPLHSFLNQSSDILNALDDYREYSIKAAKAERRLSKGLNSLSGLFDKRVGAGGNDAIHYALIAAAVMFDTLAEVDMKHSKSLHKEYESINERTSKYFKRVAKDEKLHDDVLAAFDLRAQKASAAYDKSRTRRPTLADAHISTQAHEFHISQLSSIASSMSDARVQHAMRMGEGRERMGKDLASVICTMGEAAWRHCVEGTRKGGEKVGAIVEKAIWCAVDFPLPSMSQSKESRDWENDGSGMNAGSSNAGGIRGPRPLLSPSVTSIDPHQQQQPNQNRQSFSDYQSTSQPSIFTSSLEPPPPFRHATSSSSLTSTYSTSSMPAGTGSTPSSPRIVSCALSAPLNSSAPSSSSLSSSVPFSLSSSESEMATNRTQPNRSATLDLPSPTTTYRATTSRRLSNASSRQQGSPSSTTSRVDDACGADGKMMFQPDSPERRGRRSEEDSSARSTSMSTSPGITPRPTTGTTAQIHEPDSSRLSDHHHHQQQHDNRNFSVGSDHNNSDILSPIPVVIPRGFILEHHEHEHDGSVTASSGTGWRNNQFSVSSDERRISFSSTIPSNATGISTSNANSDTKDPNMQSSHHHSYQSHDRRTSTASERSFVTSMKARYQEQKAHEKDNERRAADMSERDREVARDRCNEVSQSASLPLPDLPRSNSRVSHLAQRYSNSIDSSALSPSSFPSSSSSSPSDSSSMINPASSAAAMASSIRPHYATSSSATQSVGFQDWSTDGVDFAQKNPPSLPLQKQLKRSSYSHSNILNHSTASPSFRAYSYSPNQPPTSSSSAAYDRSSFPTNDSLTPSQQSTSETAAKASKRHSSICGCEQCSTSNYAKSSRMTTAAEEEKRQKEFLRNRNGDGERGGRRISWA